MFTHSHQQSYLIITSKVNMQTLNCEMPLECSIPVQAMPILSSADRNAAPTTMQTLDRSLTNA